MANKDYKTRNTSNFDDDRTSRSSDRSKSSKSSKNRKRSRGKNSRSNGESSRDGFPTNSGHPSTEPQNSPEWYKSDSALVADSTRFPWNWRTGDSLNNHATDLFDLDTDSDFSRTNIVPGALYHEVAFTHGLDFSATGPINSAAQFVYNKVIYNQVKTAPYDPVDLMTYFLAMSEVYSMINWAQRAFGTVNAFSSVNKYMASTMLAYEGFDPRSFTEDMSSFRYQLNTIINRAAQFAIPSTIRIFQQRAGLFANYYIEDGDMRNQLYAYTPAGVHLFHTSTDTDSSAPLASFTGTWMTMGDFIMEVLMPLALYEVGLVHNVSEQITPALIERYLDALVQAPQAYTNRFFTYDEDQPIQPLRAASKLTQDHYPSLSEYTEMNDLWMRRGKSIYLKPSAVAHMLNLMLRELTLSQDINRMSADVLAAYGSNIVGLQSMPLDALVIPVEPDEFMKLQLSNTMSLGHALFGNDVLHSEDGKLIVAPALVAFDPETDDLYKSNELAALSSIKPLLNISKNVASEDDILEMTRNQFTLIPLPVAIADENDPLPIGAFITRDRINVDRLTDSAYYPFILRNDWTPNTANRDWAYAANTGGHMVINSGVLTFQPIGDGIVSEVLEWSNFHSVVSLYNDHRSADPVRDTNWATAELIEQAIASSFRYFFPQQYLFYRSVDPENGDFTPTVYMASSMNARCDNTSLISAEQLERVHKTALLALFDVPYVAKM